MWAERATSVRAGTLPLHNHLPAQVEVGEDLLNLRFERSQRGTFHFHRQFYTGLQLFGRAQFFALSARRATYMP